MTVQGGMTGATPPTGGYGPAQVGMGFPPGPPQPAPYTRGPRRRRGAILIGAGVLLAIALGAAALVVALMSPGRQSTSGAPMPATTQQPGSTSDADRALCQAIAPLMAESDRVSNAYIDTGATGTPARDAATPKYVSDTQDWAPRIQKALEEHAAVPSGEVAPQPFLIRTLQRFIDDRKLFVANVRPGPSTNIDQSAWTDSLVAYGGPLAICEDLGVKW
jgi:hypothetical protein